MIETKFKQTELGPLPEDWDVTPISKCLSFGNGRDYKHLDSGIYPVYGTGGLITHINDFLYEGESVCIGRKGSIDKPQFHSGRFWTVDTLYYTHSFNDVIPKYVYYCFLCINWRSLNEASGVPSLSQRIIGGQYIRVASSVYEQRKIAEALSDIDALIREFDTLLEKKRFIMQAAMQDLLTARRRLPGFDEPWKEMAFKDLGYTYNGLSGKTGLDFGHGDSKFIMFVNVIYKDTISPNYFEHVNVSKGEKQNKVQKNDLIFNTSSETPDEVGMCSCVTEEYDDLYLNSFCFGFRFYKPNINPRFLTFLLRSKIGRDLMMELAQGTTRYNLPKRKFLSSKIRLPKDIHEQNEIALVLSDMNDEIEEIEVKRDKYIAVRQGMMQQLLTGKIRLI